MTRLREQLELTLDTFFRRLGFLHMHPQQIQRLAFQTRSFDPKKLDCQPSRH
jgi:hypothetical protein